MLATRFLRARLNVGALVHSTPITVSMNRASSNVMLNSARSFATSRPFFHNSPITWKSLGFAVIFGAGTVWAYDYLQKQKETRTSYVAESIGKPLIGGAFTLVDNKGNIKTDADFHGNYTLLYFGFCFCPDICPSEMVKMSKVVEILEKNADIGPIVTPLFISVDPRRDTVAQIDHYIKEFHPRMVGLTGTPDQVKDVAKSFRVYASVGPAVQEDNDYLVDHSIIIYFLDKEGNVVDFFGRAFTAEEIAAKMTKTILKMERDNFYAKLKENKGKANK